MEREKIEMIVSQHSNEKAAILSLLHALQKEDKQIEMDSLRYLAKLLKVPFANVYGLATFYSAYTTSKKGETEIRVCDGITCHINGSDAVITALRDHLRINMGETSLDGRYSLEKVECLGLCSIGPNVSFDDRIYPGLNKDKIIEILRKRQHTGPEATGRSNKDRPGREDLTRKE